MFYHFGPVHVFNRSSSSLPPWNREWFLGSLPLDFPTYGTGYWSNIPPSPGTGIKLTGIGWIDDSNYPFIYHYGEGGYLWLSTDFSTSLSNLWMWSYKDSTWIWANEFWLGWHFRFPDTWAKW